MKKIAFLFALALSSSLMAAPSSQNVPKTKEPDLVMNAKEARKIFEDQLNAAYSENKTACDNAMSFANNKIRDASSKFQTNVFLNYSENTSSSQSWGWNGYYYNTFCPLPVIVNVLVRNGYTVSSQPGKSQNHLVVSW